MLNVTKQPHILLGKEDACPIAIVVGDPGRTELLARLCESYKELNNNREYRSFKCQHEGIEFLIISHGVGAAGAGICFRELIEIGVKTMIRIGTCGSLHSGKITQGDICIAYAAAKEDGASWLLEPKSIPAVANPEIVFALSQAARSLDVKFFQGISVTSDLFYAPKVLPPTLATYRDANCHVVEMEISVLFTMCRQYDVRCGAVLVVDGCPFGWEAGDYGAHDEKLKKGIIHSSEIVFKALKTITDMN